MTTKAIVKIDGDFMLMNTDGKPVFNHRPTVVTKTGFISERIFEKQIRMIEDDIPDNSSDEEFDTFFIECKGDTDLAVASFLSKASGQPVETVAPPVIKSEAEKQAERDKVTRDAQAVKDKELADAAKKKADDAAEVTRKAQEAKTLKDKEEADKEDQRLRETPDDKLNPQELARKAGLSATPATNTGTDSTTSTSLGKGAATANGNGSK